MQKQTIINWLQNFANTIEKNKDYLTVDITNAVEKAVVSAEQGMKNTIPMVAKKGRASYLGERSRGHQDPGATSVYLMLKTLHESLVDS